MWTDMFIMEDIRDTLILWEIYAMIEVSMEITVVGILMPYPHDSMIVIILGILERIELFYFVLFGK